MVYLVIATGDDHDMNGAVILGMYNTNKDAECRKAAVEADPDNLGVCTLIPPATNRYPLKEFINQYKITVLKIENMDTPLCLYIW